MRLLATKMGMSLSEHGLRKDVLRSVSGIVILNRVVTIRATLFFCLDNVKILYF